MTYALASINPFLAARSRRLVSPRRTEPNPAAHAKPVRKVQIGPATLYNGDCFDVMPTLGAGRGRGHRPALWHRLSSTAATTTRRRSTTP